MDLALSDEQAALVDSFAALLTKLSPPERVREAETTGFDPELWGALVEVGAVVMAVGDEHGGWGASLVDLVLVAEQLGRAMASAPVIEGQVAARLLARLGATSSLGEVLDGSSLVTFAVHPVRGGHAGLVPAGAVCDAALVLEGDELRLVPIDAARRSAVANVAAAPLADLRIDGGQVLALGDAARAAFEHALDEWLVLTAAAVVGTAEAAHEQACTYATERIAFGAPIGSFQGVAHPLADDATALDGARLIVRKAAWALDRDDARARELAAMAFAVATDAGARATYDAVHVHGGYGFMLEHDAPLRYRRARGWPRVWGDATTANRRAAAARYGVGEQGGA